MLKVDVALSDDGILELRLAGDLDLPGLERLVQALVPHRAQLKHVLVDFESVTKAEEAGLRGLAQMAMVFAKRQKLLRLVGFKPGILDAGDPAVLQALPRCASREAALAEIHAAESGPVFPALLDQMSRAVEEVLKVQASCEVKCGAPVRLLETDRSNIEIAAILGLVGEGKKGVMTLCFPAASFLGIVNKMLGETNTEINSGNADAAGELLNIIFGTARKKLNESGWGLSPSIPTVVSGAKLRLSPGPVAGIARIPCVSEVGSFHLEISLKTDAQAKPAPTENAPTENKGKAA